MDDYYVRQRIRDLEDSKGCAYESDSLERRLRRIEDMVYALVQDRVEELEDTLDRDA